MRSFRPRKAAPDAIGWTTIAAGLREHDRTESDLTAATAGRIHARLVRFVEANRIVGLVAGLAVGGRPVHQEYLGVSDLGSAGRLDPRSVFGVGSVAKAVTALAPALGRAPLTAFCGDRDPLAGPATVTAWSRHTEHFRGVRVHSGGHFYFRGRTRTLIEQIVAEIRLATGRAPGRRTRGTGAIHLPDTPTTALA
ncbi:serine hydrolase [Streptacidiphilus sp. P02-A3a]|uniref:serine hydrolase n=1 Tax=Streptacidiphilus sp. P02-A3a TaxID=2704468 RepID=UPI001CDD7BF8|nr:serine hydrolase [Streptacidiphilus sp. P02-A3a]